MKSSNIVKNPTIEKTLLSMLMQLDSATNIDVKMAMDVLDKHNKNSQKHTNKVLETFAGKHGIDKSIILYIDENEDVSYVFRYESFDENEMKCLMEDLVKESTPDTSNYNFMGHLQDSASKYVEPLKIMYSMNEKPLGEYTWSESNKYVCSTMVGPPNTKIVEAENLVQARRIYAENENLHLELVTGNIIKNDV